MGPRNYGMGGAGRSRVGALVSAPPTAPDNGSGGPGVLGGIGNTMSGLNFSAATSEISDVTTGRITLGMVNFTILLMLGFYWWTRTAQGGG